ncbi:MAG: hypothetical protein AAGA20_13920 [Planctomycetota bacterium]
MTRRALLSLALAIGVIVPAAAQVRAADDDVVDRIEDLERRQAETEAALLDRDRRITELEAELARPLTSEEGRTDITRDVSPTPAVDYDTVFQSALDPNMGGFHLAETPFGTLNFSLYTYVRYLNQRGLDDTYTDSFGRTRDIDRRQDFQLQKMLL